MKTYIITGGAGFIGSALAKRLVKGGNKVYVLDDLSTGYEYNIPEEAIFYKIDVSDADKLFDLELPDIDVILHLAAQPSAEASFDEPPRDIDVNYKGTYNILKLASKYNCERFIYASSMSVYGEVGASEGAVSEDHPCVPVSYYGVNKLASEKIIKLFTKKTKIKETILRLFNVYGPGQNMVNMRQGMVSIYLSYMLEGVPVIVKGSKDRFRDFIYIDDVVEAWLLSLDNPIAYGKVYNLGSGKKTRIEDLLKILKTTFGNNDCPIEYRDNTPGDQFGIVSDISLVTRELKWKPATNLETGLNKMVDFEKRKLSND